MVVALSSKVSCEFAHLLHEAYDTHCLSCSSCSSMFSIFDSRAATLTRCLPLTAASSSVSLVFNSLFCLSRLSRAPSLFCTSVLSPASCTVRVSTWYREKQTGKQICFRRPSETLMFERYDRFYSDIIRCA